MTPNILGSLIAVLLLTLPSLDKSDEPISFENCKTFYLIRHAEKQSDGSSDPDLSTQGYLRAELLKEKFKHQNLDQILSTAYKRTINTVAELADSKELKILHYKPFQYEIIDSLINVDDQLDVLIVGHSNTTPKLVNYLLGEEALDDLNESEYDKLFIVSKCDDSVKLSILSY